jgi:phosphatidylserine decarboxylase
MAIRPSNAARERQTPTLLDYALAWPQYLYPQHLASSLAFRLTRSRWKPLRTQFIRWFSRCYGVDLSDAIQPDPNAYPDFNAFFTRALRPDARPVDATSNAVVAPVDGQISQCGAIEDGQMLQAKNRYFALNRLLGGDDRRSHGLANGRFVTVYLAPGDYHRIHMPVAGSLQEMVYIPGRLFSVSPATTKVVPNLFARNERVVAFFATTLGPMVMVLVGAVLVGSIETAWAGQVTPATLRHIDTTRYDCEAVPVRLERGEEMGRFNMGSTVIVIFADACVRWRANVLPGHKVRMGESIGNYLPAGGITA